METIIKIDLCKSKIYTHTNEAYNPHIREIVVNKLLEIGSYSFPNGESAYPDGSFYASEGDALYYIVKKPSVALRSAVKFIQTWYYEALDEFPECRIMLDRSAVNKVNTPGRPEVVGKAFENISLFEKNIGDGRIYVTESVIDDIDRTMMNFTFHSEYVLTNGNRLKIFETNYLDPRTIQDSALTHTLFVANPTASSARERVIELFLVEYTKDNGNVINFNDLKDWCKTKAYSLPPVKKLKDILNNSTFFETQIDNEETYYVLKNGIIDSYEKSLQMYNQHRKECIISVSDAIGNEIGYQCPIDETDLGELIENYIASIFSEIRYMANYFAENKEVFNEPSDKFEKFDYIIKRMISDLSSDNFMKIKEGLIIGLQKQAEQNNQFMAAVFHNVLATYYLNRSSQTSIYQIDKLKEREIFIDTNVLYALLVKASEYNEIISYLINNLSKINIPIKVYPFTIYEYEQSLESVEQQCPNSVPNINILDRNPWLLREFQSNRHKYQNSISLCRTMHSVSKSKDVIPENYASINLDLMEYGISLETQYSCYTKEEAQELWVTFRALIPKGHWDMYRYNKFLDQDAHRSDELMIHDVHCIQNLIERSTPQDVDEIGLKTIFVTLDRNRLLRLQREYNFILSPEQCLEYFLPYLFLSDIPLVQANIFPNQILSAGLSSLLIKHPPDSIELLAKFLEDPSFLVRGDDFINRKTREMAKTLNQDRFKEVMANTASLDESTRKIAAQKIIEILEMEKLQVRKTQADRYSQLRQTIREKESKIEKLTKTVRYWKQQARSQT